MVLSNYVKYVKVDDNIYALFNTLIMRIIFVDGLKLKEILNLSICDKIEMDCLIQNGIFIKNKDVDEKLFETITYSILKHSKKVSIMYLNVSTYCNLACKYCFIDNNPLSINDDRIMTLKTAINAIDKFKLEIDENNESDIAQIIIYGGEPLTNKQYFCDIISYAREICADIKITLITNGTLLDEQIVKFLKEKDIIIGLSLDGPKIVNDKQRVFKCSDESVYDVVLQKIDMLNKYNCQFGLSSTVTKDMVNHKEEVLSAYKTMGIRNVFFNIYHYSKNNVESDWRKFYEEMSDFIIAMYEELKALGINEGRIQDHLNLLSKEIFRFQACGAVGLNQITVQPNGNVCVCQGDSKALKNVIGNINDDSISDMLDCTMQNWVQSYTVCRKECQYCEALFVCGGGCPLQSEALFGSRDKLDSASCIFYKKFLTWYINLYYKIYKGGVI